MKIFFGDLVHNWEKISVWTIPLNVGFVAAYAIKNIPDLEVEIFKDPNELLHAVRETRPDIVALSSYAWNENLDKFVFEKVKAFDPSILTVGGGPNFTVLNSNDLSARPFFEKTSACDVYVVDQGEKGFVELLRHFIELDKDPRKLRDHVVPGCMTNAIASQGCVLVGPEVGALDDLDEIPSPYLTGLLDKFLSQSYVPLLETNRSCPYQCTYCALAVSTGSKLKTFSIERVFDEIEYVACRTTADYLITTDANFGILERDALIAERIHKAHLEHNYPGYLCVVWNKSAPERVMKTARAFHGLAKVGASMQSMHPDVLKAIKRRNLPLHVAAEMSKELEKDGVGFFSELIVGLPMQTFDSHIEDNKVLMDSGAEVYNYNLRLLPGTEMDSTASKDQYVREIGWRLQSSAYGIYEDQPVFEGEELVLATSTMSADEMHSLRLIHFLLQYMWGKRFFYDYLQIFRQFDVHPMEVVLEVAHAMRVDKGAIGSIWQRFNKDHQLEKFESYQAMCDYWSQPEQIERLRKGDTAKLNVYYGYELVANLDAFLALLRDVQQRVLGDRAEDAAAICDELLRFTKESFLDVTRDLRTPKIVQFSYDVLGWRAAHYDPSVLVSSGGGHHSVEFFVNDKTLERLERSLKFFSHANKDVTLRTMFDTNPSYFIHEARQPAAEAVS
jgi:radical SAM superfamily enzyme YgiQ (UPF0313 family)